MPSKGTMPLIHNELVFGKLLIADESGSICFEVT